jgi:hypothetical protein
MASSVRSGLPVAAEISTMPPTTEFWFSFSWSAD